MEFVEKMNYMYVFIDQQYSDIYIIIILNVQDPIVSGFNVLMEQEPT